MRYWLGKFVMIDGLAKPQDKGLSLTLHLVFKKKKVSSTTKELQTSVTYSRYMYTIDEKLTWLQSSKEQIDTKVTK